MHIPKVHLRMQNSNCEHNQSSYQCQCGPVITLIFSAGLMAKQLPKGGHVFRHRPLGQEYKGQEEWLGIRGPSSL